MKITKIKKEAIELRNQIVEKIVTLLTAAFGFVAALQWNNWVQQLMKPLIEKGGRSHLWLLLVAILVTIIAIIIAYFLGKLSAKMKIGKKCLT